MTEGFDGEASRPGPILLTTRVGMVVVQPLCGDACPQLAWILEGCNCH